MSKSFKNKKLKNFKNQQNPPSKVLRSFFQQQWARVLHEINRSSEASRPSESGRAYCKSDNGHTKGLMSFAILLVLSAHLHGIWFYFLRELGTSPESSRYVLAHFHA